MSRAELKDIPIECLVPGKYQTRCVFAQESLQDLANSIESEGLIQPIIVRPIGNDGKAYEIVAGERRWRAAQLARLDIVPCLVKNYTDEQVAAITPIENIQRENLNPIEEARAYQYLMMEFNYIHEEIAATVGKSRSKITNILRLLSTDTRVQELLMSGEISEGHGKIVAGLPNNLQYKMAKQCANLKWSLKKLEQEVKKASKNCSVNLTKKIAENGKDADIISLEKLISSQLGSEVKFETKKNKKSGWIKIKYFNNETLMGILDRLGIKYDC